MSRDPLSDLALPTSIWIAVLEQTADSVEILDESFRVVWANPAFEKLHGIPLSEARGKTPRELGLGDPAHRAEHESAENVVSQGGKWRGMITVPQADGSSVPVELTASPLQLSDGTSIGYVGIKRDFSDHETVKRALTEQERQYRHLLERAPVGFVLCREDGQIRFATGGLAQLLGVEAEALRGRAVWEFISEEDRASISSKGSAPSELTALTTHGPRTVRVVPGGWLDFEGEHTFCFTVEDISGEVRARSRRMLDDRLLTIGQVAAGVAHEVNNPLTWLSGDLDEIARSLDGSTPELKALMEEAQRGVERIRVIVRDLAVFTRGDDVDGYTEIEPLLRSTLNLARRELDRRADIRVVGDEDGLWVRGSTPRLGQVVLNLLLNAAAATPRERRGAIEVRFGADSKIVWIEVEDDGVGMEDDALQRAFEPFFTTRSGRGGTGLGLAIAREIVHSAGGEIRLESEAGRGTVVRLELPRATRPTSTFPLANEAQQSLRVLVVDDQRPVARAVARTMRRLGHTSEVVDGGEAALERLGAEPGFDVILCDLMMPGVDGRAVFEHIEAHWPDRAPSVIFMTGGAYTAEDREFFERVTAPKLLKPFSDEALVEALHQALA